MKLRYGEGTVDVRVRANGTTAYRVRWYGMDGKRRTQTFPTREAAEAHLLAVSGKKRQRQYRDPSALTVAEAAEEWLERNWRHWNGGTGTAYELRMEKHILPALGAVPLAQLTPSRIQRWVDSLTLAPATVASLIGALSSLLQDCVRLDVIPANPAHAVRAPRQRRAHREVWSTAQVQRVLAVTREVPRTHAFFALALATGMRPGELRALLWEDVDLDAGTVRVRRTTAQVGGVVTIRETTKAGRERVVPLTGWAVDALRAWQGRSRSPYVVAYRSRGVPNDTSLREMMRRVAAQAGVPMIGLHGLRHTAATLLMERGTHPKVASDILGHASAGITLDVYSHTTRDSLATARRAMENVVVSGPESGQRDHRQDHDQGE